MPAAREGDGPSVGWKLVLAAGFRGEEPFLVAPGDRHGHVDLLAVPKAGLTRLGEVGVEGWGRRVGKGDLDLGPRARQRWRR